MTGRRRIISNSLIDEIGDRLARNLPVRRTLPEGGRVHIDRQLPFLVVHRLPAKGAANGVVRFVRGEASYVVSPGTAKHRKGLASLLAAISSEMVEVFGGYLIVELWSGAVESDLNGAESLHAPGFRVVVPRRDAEAPSVARLMTRLERVRVMGRRATVDLAPGGRLSPPGMPRIVQRFGTAGSPVHLIGIEVKPVHRDPVSGVEYPDVARLLHRQVSRAIQECVYEFAIHQTTHRPRHYQALGRRAFVKAVSKVDAELAAIASAFDLLLMLTPVNTDRAFRSYRSRSQREPSFQYRALNVDPVMLKRDLYRVRIERVEDPTLADLFYDKQRELSLKLDLLADRGKPSFVHTSTALYGAVQPEIAAEAEQLLSNLEPTTDRRRGRSVDAATFATAAEAELAAYRDLTPGMEATVAVRDDIAALTVSAGNLLVGSGMRFPLQRVEALIQHEVGTHVVTYWNGMSQRLKLLATGLAGHDELQEGLAVLSEYLVAGLSPARLRTVAARVLAAASVLDGAEFTDTYRLLTETYDFKPRAAFQIAMRVHRSGGFVKDAVYLRGLRRVVAYLADGGRLDTLLVGKISVDHVAVIEELQRRGVLLPPPLRPTYLDSPDTHYRLERLRAGVDLIDLVESF